MKSDPGRGQAHGRSRAYGAAWVWCGPGELRRDAWVVVQGRRIQEITSRPPAAAQVHELGRGLLLPGLVNAHTHLELSFLAGLAPKPQGDFMAWIEALVALRPGYDREQAKQAARRAARFAFEQGTVLVGDITNTGRAAWAWAEAGVSAVSFFEAIGPARSEPPQPGLSWQDGRLEGRAVALHAPYSVPAWRVRALKQKAATGPLPLSIHLAESRAEVEFFAGRGAEGRRMEEFLEARGMQKAELDLQASRPLAHLMALGAVDGRTLLVHGVQLSREELAEVAASGASLCLCPRSNLGLTGAVADAPAALAAGVNLALGTDSLVSAPDLSLWAEMEALWERYPELDPEAVLAMATTGGARALGLGEYFGRIAPGFCAPLVFVGLDGAGRGEVVAAALAEGSQGRVQLVA